MFYKVEYMVGELVKARDENGHIIKGEVALVYTDALASGTNEYVPITELLVVDDNKNVLTIKPRNVLEIIQRVK